MAIETLEDVNSALGSDEIFDHTVGSDLHLLVAPTRHAEVSEWSEPDCALGRKQSSELAKMQKKYTILEIEWTETCGPFKHVGAPYLFGWLRAVYVSGLVADGRVVVVTSSDQSAEWTQYQGLVTQSDAETLVRMFTACVFLFVFGFTKL
ncbi:MAG: hypothetical protein JWM11_2574 [Planctomycetaceae bacterium]|nr:hypothetical protein [Planctomycetaceae bacterium]